MHTHLHTRTNTSLTTRMYSARRVGALKLVAAWLLLPRRHFFPTARRSGDGDARLLCAKFVHFFNDVTMSVTLCDPAAPTNAGTISWLIKLVLVEGNLRSVNTWEIRFSGSIYNTFGVANLKPIWCWSKTFAYDLL